MNELHCVHISWAEVKRRCSQIRKIVKLRQKARRRLLGISGGSITACQYRVAKMDYPLETTRHAAGKNFPTPDTSVVSIPGAIQAYPDNGLLPGATLCKHRRQVRPMMLHRTAATRR